MRCPIAKCGDKVEEIQAGNTALSHKREWVLACVGCSWQCTKRALQAWLDKWRD